MAPSKHPPVTRGATALATSLVLLTVCATLLGTPTLASAAEDPDARMSMSTGNDPARSASRIDRLFAGAEEAYHAKRWALALDAFNAIVALEPNHAKAWLRIGNVHQQRRQWLSAASAYRKAARGEDEAGGAAGSAVADHVTRAKALVNLASVNVELANAALAELNGLPAGSLPEGLPRARDEVTAAANRARDAAARASATDPPRVDDEKSARARKPGDAGRAASAGAAPSRLEIEYLRGAPRP